jgi:hypothetical protein
MKMRRKSFVGFATAALLGAGSAHAGTLTAATWTQTVPRAGPIAFTRTLAQLGATGTSTANSISVDLAYPQFTTSFFVPKTANSVIDIHVRLTQGGAQAITATAGMGSGTPGIPGTLVVMTAAHNAMGVNQSQFMVGNFTLVALPLSFGHAGQFTGTLTVVGAAGSVTIDFYAWTPGTLAFTMLTTKGVPLPDVVVMGSFDLTPDGGGTVRLVAPSKVSADCSLFQTRSVWSVATLTLTFLPETGSLLLLAAGAVALTAFARRSG